MFVSIKRRFDCELELNSVPTPKQSGIDGFGQFTV
jgi:hypothetical protein